MSETIRDRALRSIASYLAVEGIPPSKAGVTALGIEQILDALGVRLPNRPPIEDPNAVALGPAPPPGDAVTGLDAVRASLRPYGGVDRRAEYEPADQLPDLPEGTE